MSTFLRRTAAVLFAYSMLLCVAVLWYSVAVSPAPSVWARWSMVPPILLATGGVAWIGCDFTRRLWRGQ